MAFWEVPSLPLGKSCCFLLPIGQEGRSEVGKGAKNSNGTNTTKCTVWCLPSPLGSTCFLPLRSGAVSSTGSIYTIVGVFGKAERTTDGLRFHIQQVGQAEIR